MARVYLCVSIDTECDKGAGWKCRIPSSFTGVHEGVVRRLQPMFESFGAKPTYLLSPEVLRDATCAETFRALARRCELGTHLHGEYAEPGSFEPDVTRVFQRDYTPEVESQKLAYLTDLFVSMFGWRPKSFRAGRFGIGPATIPILESLGYAVESSVTPHVDWTSSGAVGLSFRGAPSQPFRPNPRNPGLPGEASILEVPVTIRQRVLNRIPGLGRYFEPRWLRPTRGTGGALVRVANDEIAEAQRSAPTKPVILNAMFHNVEVVPNTSPYAANEAQARGILARLQTLLAFARSSGIQVVGLGDVPEILARE